jgi:hypothetical protein
MSVEGLKEENVSGRVKRRECQWKNLGLKEENVRKRMSKRMSVEEFRVKGRERRVQGSERKRLALSSFNPRFCFHWHSLLLTLDFFPTGTFFS